MRARLQFLNGEKGMWTFKFIQERLTYLKESFFIERINIRIENFKCNNKSIDVTYRVGRQKLPQCKNIASFSARYYDHISNYDKQRLAKFSTLDILLQTVFTSNEESNKLINYIMEEVKNEQLF